MSSMHTSCESVEPQKAVYACAPRAAECHDWPKNDQNPNFPKILPKIKFPRGGGEFNFFFLVCGGFREVLGGF